MKRRIIFSHCNNPRLSLESGDIFSFPLESLRLLSPLFTLFTTCRQTGLYLPYSPYTMFSRKIVILTLLLTTLLTLSACSNPRSETIITDDQAVNTEDISPDERQAIEDIINGVIDTNEERWDEQTIAQTFLSRDDAIAIAEPLLFQTYGTGLIVSEKPYNTSLSGWYRTITGSLPDGHVGGVFHITLDANNGQMIDMVHGQ